MITLYKKGSNDKMKVWSIKLKDGTQFTVTPKGDFESRCAEPPPEGAWYTVEYRELTISGIPFHAVGKGFRIEEAS